MSKLGESMLLLGGVWLVALLLAIAHCSPSCSNLALRPFGRPPVIWRIISPSVRGVYWSPFRRWAHGWRKRRPRSVIDARSFAEADARLIDSHTISPGRGGDHGPWRDPWKCCFAGKKAPGPRSRALWGPGWTRRSFFTAATSTAGTGHGLRPLTHRRLVAHDGDHGPSCGPGGSSVMQGKRLRGRWAVRFGAGMSSSAWRTSLCERHGRG
jgi:hypothetical protein